VACQGSKLGGAAGSDDTRRKGMSLTSSAHVSARGERKGAMVEGHKPEGKT
jgi:hypothetical protein